MKGRFTLATPAMATALGVLVLALIVAEIPLSRASVSQSGGSLWTLFVIVPFALVGVVVARRQPRNAVGWILLAAGFSSSSNGTHCTVAAFSSALRDAVDLDRVQDDLVAVVHLAMQPSHVSVWLRERTSV